MRPIGSCFNQKLTELCQRAQQLQDLTQQISALLPAELAPHCQVGSFNKGCLVITTQDGAWASQLRYLLPELRDTLRKDAGMFQLTSIKVIVVEPEAVYELANQKPKPRLSDKAKASIISETQQCSYQPLRDALLHLADA